MRLWCVVVASACGALAAPQVRAADFCSSCELQLGIGATYNFGEFTRSAVIPLAFNFDHDRWELGVFRFTHDQHSYSTRWGAEILWATPYWGSSLTRRLEVIKTRHWRLFAGLGASYKTQEDRESGSLWNFSEQLGVRFLPSPGYSIELVGRHWSNAGLKLPNHGQDFVTLMFSIYP